MCFCVPVYVCMWSFPVASYCQLIVKHSLQTLSPGFKIALFRRDLLGNRGWVLVMEWSEAAEVEKWRESECGQEHTRGNSGQDTGSADSREEGRFPGMEVQHCLSFPSMLCCSLFPPLWQTTQGLFWRTFSLIWSGSQIRRENCFNDPTNYLKSIWTVLLDWGKIFH